LSDGWSLWSVALLRATGFPFALLESALESEEAACAAATHPGLREAIAWQNRNALIYGIDRLKPGGTMKKAERKALRQFLRYLQRYAAKNDTIGFFGPLGWVRLLDSGGGGSFQPADSLVDARLVSFEPWAARAILASCADAVAKTPLRLGAHLRIEGHSITGPERIFSVDAENARLLAAVDGRTTKEALIAGGASPEALERLVALGIVQTAPTVSVAADPGARYADSPALSRFNSYLRSLEQAAGNAEDVCESLSALDRDFETTTGTAPTRHPGRTYGGRTLVYHDCRRGGALTLDSETLGPLRDLLAFLGTVARGYTYRIAGELASDMRRIFREAGRSRLTLPQFWRLTDPLFLAEQPEAVRRIAQRLGTDWSETFGDEAEIDLARAKALLLPRWRAPSPGWPGARHHSPDIMWAARDSDALLSGRALPIVAEFHPGVSTFTTLSVLGLCPVRDELEGLWREDFPEPLVSPIPHEAFARSTQDARLAVSHFHIDTGQGYESGIEGAQVLRAADLDIIDEAGRLWAETTDKRHRFDVMAIFERRIKLRAAVAFPLGPPGPGPRRLIGGVVVRRASWVATPPAMPRDRFRAGVRTAFRDWLGNLGAPDRVFVAVEGEVKPVFVDASSDLSLDMLLSMLDGGSIQMSEMLPASDGLWLSDGCGARYTSEIRLTMTDPAPYDGDAVWAQEHREARPGL
jgi:hypothetical protein